MVPQISSPPHLPRTTDWLIRPLALASIVILLCLSLLQPVLAAMGDPAGVEFRVNTETNSSQHNSSVAMDADGDFIIVWQSFEQDGDRSGIYAQRYHADGSPNGDEFLVNQSTEGTQQTPDVAMAANGRFVIVWSGPGSGNLDIFARRYNGDGDPIGGEFQVNTSGSFLRTPAVAMNAHGDFVVTWSAEGFFTSIYKRAYRSDGAPFGDSTQVNTFTDSLQANADIAMDADGGYVIAWESRHENGERSDIFARRYDEFHIPVSDNEFRINLITEGNQYSPAVAMNAHGRYVVTWRRTTSGGPGEDPATNVNARLWGQFDNPLTGDQVINTTTDGFQFKPSVAMDASGDFVILWTTGTSLENPLDIMGQRFDNFAQPMGDEFRVNTHSTGTKSLSAIAMDANGSFVGSWQSGTQDGSGHGVYAQRYAGVDFTTVGNGTPESCTEAAIENGVVFVNGALKMNFNCGDLPHVIPFSSSKSLENAVEIDGGGLITFAAEDETRIFEIEDDAIVILKGLTIADGNPPSSSLAHGGAIRVTGGHLIGEEILLINNYTPNPGGAVFAFLGSMQFTDCIVADNRTAGWGGGINVEDSAAYFNRCLFEGNHAGVDGGALRVRGESYVELLNSTLTDNSAEFDGGAMAVTNDSSVIRVINNTVVRNQASNGGGFFLDGIQSILRFTNSIIAGNSGGDCGKQVEVVNYTASGRSIDSDASCWVEAEDFFDTNLLVQLKLGALSDNGGFSRTIPLFSGSTAIDRGNPTRCSDFGILGDQRGHARDLPCDVGAYEATDVGPAFSPTITQIGPIDFNPAGNFAVLVPIAEKAGAPRAVIFDASNGSKERNVGFNRHLLPKKMAGLPDLSISSNGEPEIAVMGHRGTSGQPIINIRDSLTKQNFGEITFDRDQGATKLLVLADGPDAGTDPEIAVLGPRGSDNRPAAEIRDSVTAELNTLLYFTRDLQITDAIALNDSNENGAAEIAVIGRRTSNGRYLLQVRDSLTRSKIFNKSLNPQFVPVALAAVPDMNNNGSQEIAILTYHPVEQRSRVEIIDGLTRASINNINYNNAKHSKYLEAIGISVLPDGADAGTDPEIAVLLRRTAEHKLGAATLVETRDAAASNLIGRAIFDSELNPLQLSVSGDADNNSQRDISVLLYNPVNGSISVETRDSSSGNLTSKALVSKVPES